MNRKRILIVNCYADEFRLPVARPNRIPQSLAPAYLAGTCSRERCEARIYDEVSSGPFRDAAALAATDMLVLTGLNTAYDRMRYLAACARTQNPRIAVVAGGPAVRVLPQLSRRWCDYPCTGDVEELGGVLDDVFGPGHAAETVSPRMDLLPPGRIGYIETSRNCQFRCSFCTLSAKPRCYQPYAPEEIRRQVLNLGYRDVLVLLDNNFYGPNKAEFAQRLAMLGELHEQKRFGGWAALVTNDFFTPNNLREARRAGCIALFSGVETFDTQWLRSCHKLQNTKAPQTALIRGCLESGILFMYGLMLDVASRHIADLRAEIDFILSRPDLSLPGFLALPIPVLGTPYFRECLAGGKLLPNLRLRNMDSTTLCLRPLDPLSDTIEFVRGIQTMAGRRRRVAAHAAGFARRYFRNLKATQHLIALGTAAALCAPALMTSTPSNWLRPAVPRTYLASTEPDDSLGAPDMPVAAAYRDYLRPTLVTDAHGHLAGDMAELAPRAQTTAHSYAVAAS